MSLVLGLHFGHDASMCLLSDGLIISYQQIERHIGLKHAGGILAEEIVAFLEGNGVVPSAIACITITSTQSYEIILDDIAIFDVSYETYDTARYFSRTYISQQLAVRSTGSAADSRVLSLFERLVNRLGKRSKILPYLFHSPVPFVGLSRSFPLLEGGALIPATASLLGTSIKAFFVAHHVAHAAGAFYKAGHERALVITNDGGTQKDSGVVCIGQGGELKYFGQHHQVWGWEYDQFSSCTFARDAGKLMGLSAYSQVVGAKAGELSAADFNSFSLEGLDLTEKDGFCDRAMSEWHRGKYAGLDQNFLKGARVAALAQRRFEDRVLRFVRYVSSLDSAPICLSGGSFLNCPTNALIAESCPSPVFVDYSPNDEGLAFGSAALVYHSVMVNRVEPTVARKNASPFQGSAVREESDAIRLARQMGMEIRSFSSVDKVMSAAADLLLRGDVGALMRGKAEVGPRALGHRSIVSLSTKNEDRDRVNVIKNRELWRPLAPVVLKEDFSRFFSGHQNPYMLMTNTVTSDLIPAVEHVDRSSRVQVVGRDGDFTVDTFSSLLSLLRSRCEAPVVINTSFNDKDVPIYDSAVDAVKFLGRTNGLQFLALNNVLLTKVCVA